MFLDFLKGFWDSFKIILCVTLWLTFVVSIWWWPWWLFVIFVFVLIPTAFGVYNAYKAHKKKRYEFYLNEIKNLDREKEKILNKLSTLWLCSSAENTKARLNQQLKEIYDKIAYNTEMLKKYE